MPKIRAVFALDCSPYPPAATPAVPAEQSDPWERWVLEEKDGSSTEHASGLAGSAWVHIPKARVLHRVWGGRFASFGLELVGEGAEPAFAEGLLENIFLVGWVSSVVCKKQ